MIFEGDFEMAKLERVPSMSVPGDFYSTMSDIWILAENGKVYKRKQPKRRKKIHAQIWGETMEVWDNPERGYYNEKYGLIYCHGAVSQELERKLAKKFPSAIRLIG